MKDGMVRVLPKKDGSCAVKLPRRALRVGTTMRLPVTVGDTHEVTNYTANCTVVEIHWDKHWIRCAYIAGKTRLHECYQFLEEDEMQIDKAAQREKMRELEEICENGHASGGKIKRKRKRKAGKYGPRPRPENGTASTPEEAVAGGQ